MHAAVCVCSVYTFFVSLHHFISLQLVVIVCSAFLINLDNKVQVMLFVQFILLY